MTQWRGYAVFWEPSSCCRGCMGAIGEYGSWSSVTMKTSVCVVSYGDLRQSTDAAVSCRKKAASRCARSENYDSRHTRVRSGAEVLQTSLPGYRALMLIPWPAPCALLSVISVVRCLLAARCKLIDGARRRNMLRAAHADSLRCLGFVR